MATGAMFTERPLVPEPPGYRRSSGVLSQPDGRISQIGINFICR